MNDGVYDTRFFREMCERLGDVIGRDLEASASGAGPVLEQRSVEAILTALDFERVVAGGADLGELAAVVLAHSNRLRHPRYMGHQVAVPMLPSVMNWI